MKYLVSYDLENTRHERTAIAEADLTPDVSFVVRSVTNNVATIKGGTRLLSDGKAIVSKANGVLGADYSVNLKTNVSGTTSPSANSTYTLFLDLSLAGQKTTAGVTEAPAYPVDVADGVFYIGGDPETVDRIRYVPLAFIRTDGSSNYVSFSSIPKAAWSVAATAGPAGPVGAGFEPVIETFTATSSAVLGAELAVNGDFSYPLVVQHPAAISSTYIGYNNDGIYHGYDGNVDVTTTITSLRDALTAGQTIYWNEIYYSLKAGHSASSAVQDLSSLPTYGQIFINAVDLDTNFAGSVNNFPSCMATPWSVGSEVWTKTGQWVIANGVATLSGASQLSSLTQSILTTGHSYRVTATLSNRTSGSVCITDGSTVRSPGWNTNGVHSVDFNSAGTTDLYIAGSNPAGSDYYAGDIDNVSVKEITSSSSQTDFVLAGSFTADDYIEVLVDGVEISGWTRNVTTKTITVTAGVTAGKEVKIKIFKRSAAFVEDFTVDAVGSGDPNTKLLLHFNNVGSSTVIDEVGHTPTQGSIPQTNDNPKFGSSAAILGSGSNWCRFEHATDFDIGTNDFTIDFWAYITSSGVASAVLHLHSNFAAFYLTPRAGGDPAVAMIPYFDGAPLLGTANAVSLNAWHHIALTRSGTTVRGFVDGVLIDTWTGVSTDINSTMIDVGAEAGSNPVAGYIDELRIVNGVAVWTDTFTAPTNPHVLATPRQTFQLSHDIAETTPLEVFHKGVLLEETVGFTRNATANTVTVIPTTQVGEWIRVAGPTPDGLAGRTFTLPVTDGSAGQVLATDGSGNLSWVTPSAGSSSGWSVKNSAYTIVSGDRILADTHLGQVTFTLPANGWCEIMDAYGSWATNNCVVTGGRIEGVDEDLILNANGGRVILAYVDSTRGWAVGL